MPIDRTAVLEWGREYALCLRVIAIKYHERFEPPPLPDGIPWRHHGAIFEAIRTGVAASHLDELDSEEAFRFQHDYLKDAPALAIDAGIDHQLLIELFTIGWNAAKTVPGPGTGARQTAFADMLLNDRTRHVYYYQEIDELLRRINQLPAKYRAMLLNELPHVREDEAEVVSSKPNEAFKKATKGRA